MQKCKLLEEEGAWMKTRLERLTAENKNLQVENRRVVQQLSTHEEARAHVRGLVLGLVHVHAHMHVSSTHGGRLCLYSCTCGRPAGVDTRRRTRSVVAALARNRTCSMLWKGSHSS